MCLKSTFIVPMPKKSSVSLTPQWLPSCCTYTRRDEMLREAHHDHGWTAIHWKSSNPVWRLWRTQSFSVVIQGRTSSGPSTPARYKRKPSNIYIYVLPSLRKARLPTPILLQRDYRELSSHYHGHSPEALWKTLHTPHTHFFTVLLFGKSKVAFYVKFCIVFYMPWFTLGLTLMSEQET